MSRELQGLLSEVLGIPIIKLQPLSGGDISSAYLLYTKTEKLFAKIHNGAHAYTMFKAEKLGLNTISKTGKIRTPEVICCQQFEGCAGLIMEYIAAKTPDNQDMHALGQHLANLHGISYKAFGFKEDNFIGSLPQSNTLHESWASFYTHERLLPQLNLARSKNLLSEEDVPKTEVLEKKLADYFFDVILPSLLHGDLWSGNYLIASGGVPYLIDPAVYYGHSEVDLAMTKLFGGFGTPFYKAYCEVNPELPGAEERQHLYQLYYLLVHLNLFGSGYYHPVSKILKRYFG